ncbi:hypothetical protein ACFLKB_04890 [Clostridium sp. FAM 1755]|uniref:hypothetical protein n=1 Tax=Clostridium caseinilyticum TaxID=3350403 RepID=UPI0038F68DD2
MAIAALGIVEVGLDLAVGDNTSAAVGLLCLFPMGKGFKYVTEIGGDAIKGGSKAKNLYKVEGLLKMDLQKFGNEMVKYGGFKSLGDGLWKSTEGLIYGKGSKQGNRVLHVLEHASLDSTKPLHSVFKLV